MENHYHLSTSKKAAKVSMNMFVCHPRKLNSRDHDEKEVFDVEILERHPFTAQTFAPLGSSSKEMNTCYLVIVAPTLPNRSWDNAMGRRPPYPMPTPQRKKSLKERLLGTRPDPFTNDFSSSATPFVSTILAGPKPKGPGPPDLANIKAFIARGDQAVSYGPGTWHAPMVVLGQKPIEFVVVQYMNGVGIEDCQETEMSVEEVVAVDVSGAFEAAVSPEAKL